MFLFLRCSSIAVLFWPCVGGFICGVNFLSLFVPHLILLRCLEKSVPRDWCIYSSSFYPLSVPREVCALWLWPQSRGTDFSRHRKRIKWGTNNHKNFGIFTNIVLFLRLCAKRKMFVFFFFFFFSKCLPVRLKKINLLRCSLFPILSVDL